jgi:predicted nucleotidyltransferase
MKLFKDRRMLKYILTEDGRNCQDRLINFFNKLYEDHPFLRWEMVDIPIQEYRVDKLVIQHVLEIRYLYTSHSHEFSVRFADGKFWIMSESNESKDFELSDENIDEFIEYSENLDEEVPENIFYCYGSQGQLYKVDIEKQTCTCKGFQYKYSHHPVDNEERFCKHMQLIFTTYPDLLPNKILDKDSAKVENSDGKVRYPRDLFEMYVNDIRAVVNRFSIFNKFEVCGSYRRLKPMVSDLDILVTLNPGVESWNSFLDYLENTMGYQLIQEIGRGEAKAAYMIDGMVHVDFKVVPNESWPFALLHFTGSKETNIMMRRAAIRKGCHLNEYGLYYDHDNSSVPGIKTEKDVFEFLGLKYKEPWER